MIIKTAESRNLGAKFIDNVDSLSKIECLHLCCETESCDVFVYEEKVSCIALKLETLLTVMFLFYILTDNLWLFL